MPISRIPPRRASPTHCWQREIPGVRLVNFGHLGDGNLHYNVQALRAATPRPSCATTRTMSTTLCTKAAGAVRRLCSRPSMAWARSRPTSSRALPVARGLSMMRAIKQALDPQNS